MTGDTNVLDSGTASPGPSASSGPTPNSTSSEDAAMSSIVNLQIVSPSFDCPISFQSLPTTTSVKDVKEKIRDTWEVKPSLESQRLIYRGRMLARDAETLMEIFGEETLKRSDQQTFHLVLRPPVTDNPQVPTPTTNPLVDRINASGTPIPTAVTRPGEQTNTLPPAQPFLPVSRRADGPQNAYPYGYPQQPMNPLQAQNDLQNRLMLQRLQLQHEHLTEQLNNLLTQDQRLRAIEAATNRLIGTPYNAMGNTPHGQQHYTNNIGGQQYALPAFQNILPQQQQQMYQQMYQQQQLARGQGMQTAPDLNAGLPAQNSAAQATAQNLHHGHPNRIPDHTTTITRHGTNANGDRWQITVNESTTVIPPGNSYQPPQVPTAPGFNETAANLQHLLQSAERLAMSARLNLAPRPGGTPPPGFNVPTAPQRPSSTPPIGRLPRPMTLSNNSFPNTPRMAMAGPSFAAPSSDSPTVYLMSSPNGPQALLVHNSQTFYSGNPYIANQLNGSAPPGFVGEARNRRERSHRHRHRTRDQNAPAVVDGAAGPQVPPPVAQVAQPAAQAQRGAIWPHVWLVVRLLIFIWFFTSGGASSWSRLFVIWGIALFLFIANTGVFNDVFGAFWNPIRQHLENLLPLAGPNPQDAGRGRAAPAEGNAAPAPNAEPNPEEVARRLLNQRRREDASWLMTQFRRVEHAVLLFVASIVPGTAERHIEARTIEENRILEQRRQEAAAAAAALEAEAVANPEAEVVSDLLTGAQPAVVEGNEQAGIAIQAEPQAIPM